VRNDFSGGPELFDDQEASRFLHQHALALVVHVARSDDKADRDAANELVLVDRERKKFLTSRV
jgi:O-glycosyl hydrolase